MAELFWVGETKRDFFSWPGFLVQILEALLPESRGLLALTWRLSRSSSWSQVVFPPTDTPKFLREVLILLLVV